MYVTQTAFMNIVLCWQLCHDPKICSAGVVVFGYVGGVSVKGFEVKN